MKIRVSRSSNFTYWSAEVVNSYNEVECCRCGRTKRIAVERLYQHLLTAQVWIPKVIKQAQELIEGDEL